jgi:hypothetical protein
MLIPGKLSRTSLGDVLGGLARLEASGRLELVELPPSRHVHWIELRAGQIASVLSPVGPSLLRMLGNGSARPLAVGRTAAEAWLDSGHSEPMVREALEQQRRMRLEYLFALRDARLGFRALSPVGLTGLELRNLSPTEVLPGRQRHSPRVHHAGPVAPPREHLLGTLGLASGASPEDVKRAFRDLARRLHPDARPASATPEERARLAQRFAQVSRAYHELVG